MAEIDAHPLVDRAIEIVGPRPYFRAEDWEDDLGDVVLALVERARGRRIDPRAALEATRKRRRYLDRVEAPMFAGTTGDASFDAD